MDDPSKGAESTFTLDSPSVGLEPTESVTSRELDPDRWPVEGAVSAPRTPGEWTPFRRAPLDRPNTFTQVRIAVLQRMSIVACVSIRQ